MDCKDFNSANNCRECGLPIPKYYWVSFNEFSKHFLMPVPDQPPGSLFPSLHPNRSFCGRSKCVFEAKNKIKSIYILWISAQKQNQFQQHTDLGVGRRVLNFKKYKYLEVSLC